MKRIIAVQIVVFLVMVLSNLQLGHAQESISIEHIDHYAILANDLPLSAAWYEKLFGFRPVKKWDGVWLVGNSTARVGIFQAGANVQKIEKIEQVFAIQHVAFSLARGDLNKAKISLKQLGVIFREEDIGIASSIFLNDLDRNEIELIEYK